METIIFAITALSAFGVFCLYMGATSKEPKMLMIGFVVIMVGIYIIHEAGYFNICHNCFHHYGEMAYCENCGIYCDNCRDSSEHAEKSLVCSTCNTEVDSNYCQNCGISREEISSSTENKTDKNIPEITRTCAECKSDLPDAANFCPECGIALND